MRFLLLASFSFSICFGAEVDLILSGRVVDNSSSRNPLKDYSIQAYKIEDYPGHNSIDTSSVIGFGTTDSNGFFMIPMNGSASLQNDDSICILFEGFGHCNSVKKSRNNWLYVYDDSKQVIVGDRGGITKGDTVVIVPGESESYYTFDPVFGPPSMPFLPNYADSTLLPDWVTFDECTMWVCIRINAPENQGITACKLVKSIDDSLTYTFDFYINVTANTDLRSRLENALNSSSYCFIAQVESLEILDAYDEHNDLQIKVAFLQKLKGSNTTISGGIYTSFAEYNTNHYQPGFNNIGKEKCLIFFKDSISTQGFVDYYPSRNNAYIFDDIVIRNDSIYSLDDFSGNVTYEGILLRDILDVNEFSISTVSSQNLHRMQNAGRSPCNIEMHGKSIIATITLSRPDMLDVSLFSARGQIIAKEYKLFFMPGKNAIHVTKPAATGLYFLQVKGKHTNIRRAIHIRN
jgi:hypothetical protein